MGPILLLLLIFAFVFGGSALFIRSRRRQADPKYRILKSFSKVKKNILKSSKRDEEFKAVKKCLDQCEDFIESCFLARDAHRDIAEISAQTGKLFASKDRQEKNSVLSKENMLFEQKAYDTIHQFLKDLTEISNLIIYRPSNGVAQLKILTEDLETRRSILASLDSDLSKEQKDLDAFEEKVFPKKEEVIEKKETEEEVNKSEELFVPQHLR